MQKDLWIWHLATLIKSVLFSQTVHISEISTIYLIALSLSIPTRRASHRLYSASTNEMQLKFIWSDMILAFTYKKQAM